MMNNRSIPAILTVPFLIFISLSCQREEKNHYSGITVNDSDLQLELIAQEPSIKTPIGLTIDDQDAIYIMESHTHSPMKEYEGPKFDRIKKGVDDNKDGIPEDWIIFADSLEDGMNLTYAKDIGLFATTKNSVLLYKDKDRDGVSDEKQTLLSMIEPKDIYDHAGILGIAYSNDGWVYVSRGNTGGRYWQVKGADQTSISGYGDGGNLFRCKSDGSALEEVATGFWNPFDIKFVADGRLLLTDNDPDSRGPNRLIEIVAGGDYGYKSLYGGSGIHPFLSWNGELPGTLPYAAPLGEAPCALIDAGLTNFGSQYTSHILVNVWEENNIVRIPLSQKGSSVTGKPEVLIQGDSLFHPVAFAINSKGDLYFTDWVIRQYPNHGHGKIWRLHSKNAPAAFSPPSNFASANRFAPLNETNEALIELLKTGDDFEKTIIRQQLAQSERAFLLSQLINNQNPELRLQGLLIFLKRADQLDEGTLQNLLQDADPRINKITLVYIGLKMRQDMAPELQAALSSGQISPELFETFLAAVRHIQPAFVKAVQEKSASSSKDNPRKLPAGYIKDILINNSIDESNRAIALPYLQKPNAHQAILLSLLQQAKTAPFQMALMQALQSSPSQELAAQLLSITQNKRYSEDIQAKALQLLALQSEDYCNKVQALLQSQATIIQYAAIKYLCRCSDEASVKAGVDKWVSKGSSDIKTVLQSAWAFCNGTATDQPESDEAWLTAVDGNGSFARGQLVFEALQSQCVVCHKVDGWGGMYGPDLSNIGSSKSRAQLINAILNPSLEIAPEWQGWFVTDEEGRTHYGRQIDVHLKHVELMNTNGHFDRYNNPKTYGVAEKSLMTDGLENTMTKEEFNDLIAFLEALK